MRPRRIDRSGGCRHDNTRRSQPKFSVDTIEGLNGVKVERCSLVRMPLAAQLPELTTPSSGISNKACAAAVWRVMDTNLRRIRVDNCVRIAIVDLDPSATFGSPGVRAWGDPLRPGLRGVRGTDHHLVDPTVRLIGTDVGRKHDCSNQKRAESRTYQHDPTSPHLCSLSNFRRSVFRRRDLRSRSARIRASGMPESDKTHPTHASDRHRSH